MCKIMMATRTANVENSVIYQNLPKRMKQHINRYQMFLHVAPSELAVTRGCKVIVSACLKRDQTNSAQRRHIQGYLINLHKYLKRVCKVGGARLLSVMPSDRTRDNEHKLKTRIFPLNIRTFYHEGDRALAQITQGGCELSILEDTQKLPRYCPG